ncbi:MAG: hypothetical protein A2V65_05250 [Deltaproteobacteria bacterium RBG_13_49_15]|nr:MAG: hypothetical protein A2V65_05250 [Deltaproteobacteria bacterium RBG_13_49_15]
MSAAILHWVAANLNLRERFKAISLNNQSAGRFRSRRIDPIRRLFPDLRRRPWVMFEAFSRPR